MSSRQRIVFGIPLFFILFFSSVPSKTEEIYDSRKFKDYWYGGTARAI
ncbi:MAG: hypothetical protein WBD99_12485 [Thermodesulfobacteriota bacterium]